MKEFMQFMRSEPIKKPAYIGEFFYDFKKYRTRRSFCCIQFFYILLRYVKEHWSNKARFLALLIMPSVFVFVGWHFARYFYNKDVESRIMSPDFYPMKNKIMVNEKT